MISLVSEMRYVEFAVVYVMAVTRTIGESHISKGYMTDDVSELATVGSSIHEFNV